MGKAPSVKAPSPAGYAVDLSPQGEVGYAHVAERHLSLWGRGRPAGTGEGAFRTAVAIGALLLGATAASAASLVLPHERYGNAEGCDYLATGNVENDALQHLTKDYLATYGMGCSIVDVNADPAGNQRVAGICGYEGEEMLGAEDFIVAVPLASGKLKIYAASGETWGELEPCL